LLAPEFHIKSVLVKASRNPVCVFLAVFLIGMLHAACGAEQNGLSPQARKDFEWFSNLSFPDTKSCPYVRVATGQWSQSGDEPPRNRFIKAFLLATNASSFRVLTLDLFDRTFTPTNSEAKPYTSIGFERLVLTNEVAETLRALRTPPAKDALWQRFGEQLTQRGEVFTMAWACWRNGLDLDAQQLYEQTQKIPSRRNRDETTSTFREALEKELGHAMMWRAIVNFGDTSITRNQLFVQFESIVKNYPHSEHLERAKQTASVLKRMISEDEMHASPGRTNLNELTQQEQVRELIFRLRDQNGHQFSQPGWCDIFDDWVGATNTPAHELVKLGYVAVPQLIAALGDPTFSRSVGYHRDFYFSHTVLTVGDCTQAILRRITGKSFFEPRSTFSYMSKDGEIAATRKASETWWADYQKKGEKQMLIDAISSPSQDSPAQAEMLCQRYPEVAAATLIRGAEATTNSWIRTQLVEQVSKLHDPPVADFLAREMLAAPSLTWQKPHDDSGIEEVVHFLGSSDSVVAVEALGNDLRRRPVSTRLEVIECLGETNSSFYPQPEATSTATLNAIEKCLVQALEDTDERVGMSGSRGDKTFSDPRICDMAGYFLAERWSDHYTFDLSATLRKRDRQRVECINAWRRANNVAQLPVPHPPASHLKPEQATWVTGIDWAEHSVKPGASFAEAVNALKDKPLEPNELAAFFAHFAGKPQPDTSGVEFKAIKDEDLTGVLLTLRLLPGTPPTKSQGWNVHERVTLGRKSLLGSSGNGILGSYSNLHHWNDFADAVAKAVAAAPETPFEISVGLTAGGSE
jgi:hypothetical protein